MTNNKNIFKQWDSRWGNLPYPRRPKTISSSGCGCCSVTHVLIEEPEYSDWTPKNVQPYMVKNGFAVYGHGTSWSGITKALEHYGYKVKEPNISNTMAAAWVDLKDSLKRGVILFKGGTKGGVTWTLGGHYVAFVDYKVRNGKHYFKTKDSGRWNDGWHCYESTMAGLMPKIWICKDFKSKAPKVKKLKGYTGKLPAKTIKRGSKGDQVKRWQLFLRWAFNTTDLKAGGHFKTRTDKYTRYFQKANGLVADGIVGPKTRRKAERYLK